MCSDDVESMREGSEFCVEKTAVCKVNSGDICSHIL